MGGAASVMEIGVNRTGATELRRRWRADDPWAALLIVHGIAEHSGRYERTAARLAAAGIDVHAFDLQGFGASAGRRADIESFAVYRSQILDNLVRPFASGLPAVLFGHSMGGLLAVDYALSRHRQPDLVVLSSPALDASVPVWQRRAAPFLAKAAPRLTLANPIDPRELFTDPAAAEDYRTDPLVTTRSTVRLGALLFRCMEQTGRSLDLYRAPTLVMHGGADTVVPPEVSAPLGRRPNVERRVYPGLRHGAVNEPAGARLIDDAVEWIRSRTSAAPRGGP